MLRDPTVGPGEALLSIGPLAGLEAFDAVAATIRAMPSVLEVRLVALQGACAVVVMTLDRPVALPAELRAALGVELVDCVVADERFELVLRPGPGTRSTVPSEEPDRAPVRPGEDPLTRLWDRARMEDELERRAAEGRRYGVEAALLAVTVVGLARPGGVEDVDGAARAIRTVVRDSDCCARVGGARFLVLLTHTSGAAASVVAERLTTVIGRLPAEDGEVAVHTGIAVLGPGMTARGWAALAGSRAAASGPGESVVLPAGAGGEHPAPLTVPRPQA